MTDQTRRSSRSVCANLAEAFRKRKYLKDEEIEDIGMLRYLDEVDRSENDMVEFARFIHRKDIYRKFPGR